MANLDPGKRLSASKAVAEALRVDPARSGTIRLANALSDHPEPSHTSESGAKGRSDSVRNATRPSVEVVNENAKCFGPKRNATPGLDSATFGTST
jgi:hypothetical protein